MKCKELRKGLEKAVQKDGLANPEAIDANALELLKSGVLTVEDYSAFSEKYSGNSTMLKLVAKYALEASEKRTMSKTRLRCVFFPTTAKRVWGQFCGLGTNWKAWRPIVPDAEEAAAPQSDPTHIISMGKWWEELAGQSIENF